MNTIAVIQARMQSSRLPGKVMLPILGQPMLAWVVGRVELSQRVDSVVVAASDQPADQPIWDWCRQNNIPCVRGDQQDVLSRYCSVTEMFSPKRIVRITSDCPLIDPDVIDETISLMDRQPELDYACNFLPDRTFPRGLDVEVITRRCLQQVASGVTSESEREHVTLRIYRNPDQFRIDSIGCPDDCSSYRWTVDTTEDRKLVCQIYDFFGSRHFGYRDILQAYSRNPDWHSINHNIHQKAA